MTTGTGYLRQVHRCINASVLLRRARAPRLGGDGALPSNRKSREGATPSGPLPGSITRVVFWRAKGPGEGSLGQRPRYCDGKELEGRRPDRNWAGPSALGLRVNSISRDVAPGCLGPRRWRFGFRSPKIRVRNRRRRRHSKIPSGSSCAPRAGFVPLSVQSQRPEFSVQCSVFSVERSMLSVSPPRGLTAPPSPSPPPPKPPAPAPSLPQVSGRQPV